MLSQSELQLLLVDMESDRIERTESISNNEKFCQAICAFANDLPNHRKAGYLLIGAKDDGSFSNLKVTDELLKNLAGIRSDGNVLPQPALTVAKFSFDEGDIAVVEVQPSDLPPVRYKGRVWIRVGPRKAIANEQEERILSERRVALARSFDARPCVEAKIGDLALGQFDTYRRQTVDPETILANHRPVELQLSSLRLFDMDRECSTFAGVLLFGKNPRYFLPGAYIQYLELSGTNLTDIPEQQAEISGDLVSVMHELSLRLKSIIKISLRNISNLKEQQVTNYPEIALKELLMNAVMHRNYDSNTPIRFYVFSDHIEIHSPGGLYGEVTAENFPNRNSYRNPIIAEAMKSLGFVNRFGYGVQRAQALLSDNGNPQAEFTFDEHTVLVKIMKRAE
ncbi:ATP-binding protein [Undibacterium sp. RTI2.1]|uniref:RNA-binding domain-containing protein n=2 Tax=Pseudomonadota TaxID=1224 RepID=UPI002AB38F75|nr:MULTISPECIES: ATP-binding protein [unclassified Undibacterium]MDY7538603.1 ATP-binding protein [Undibacterium sp. 5I1]MEB0031292.1 ATP-binding protein [Undibacterium sp. RTI2.1]MEB0116316.1 ATP-binding protein [Undibacterium sp. RTI2.2]MEB0231446.1 ATP-binding protein [Undibacterium sp. 10I3]MEB0258105.1 ATP-binding protein [Undibacterium sp. 5I1]